jgi:hypothetical protein
MFRVGIAGAWYTSGTFWSGAGTVAGVLGAIAAIWVTLITGFPRRRLFYRMRAVAPLLITPANQHGDVELLYRGNRLTDPRALTIELISRGRKDIPSEAYDDGRPLHLDVGALVVEVLQVSCEPESLPVPYVSSDKTSLMIGPSLIGRRHKITLTVLTDGGPPSLSCKSSLIDVQVRRRADEQALQDAIVPWALPWLFALLTLLGAALLFAVLAGTWPAVAVMSAALVVLAMAVTRGISAVRSVKR